MITIDQLNKLYHVDDAELSHHELMGKRSAVARGYPYYGRLKQDFNVHWSHFASIHKRVDEKIVDTEFEYSPEGFIKFILCMQDYPNQMSDPTVGRLDHSKGYFTGNMIWQERSENSLEASSRTFDVSRFQDSPNLSKLANLKSLF